MAGLWELYGLNGQFLQSTYMGLTSDIKVTPINYIPYKPHIGETVTVVPGIYLFCDTMHVYNR